MALVATSLAKKLEDPRDGKSLLNTFPFNARGAAGGHHDHHDHHDHHGEHHAVASARAFSAPAAPRAQRQGDDDVALDIGSIAAAGERCIDKVVMETSTEYDDVITCKHSYSEKCHTTYTTDFEPQQEKVCEENFIKECFIEYKKSASQETVEFCYTPLVCEGEGPEECKTVYESQCETRYKYIHSYPDLGEGDKIYPPPLFPPPSSLNWRDIFKKNED